MTPGLTACCNHSHVQLHLNAPITRKVSFLSTWPFHWILVINLANLMPSENSAESASTDTRGELRSSFQSTIEIEKSTWVLLKRHYPFFISKMLKISISFPPQQKNKGKPLFPCLQTVVSKITWKSGSITSKLLCTHSLFLESVKLVSSYWTLWQNPESTFQTQEIKEELNNKMPVPILAAVNSSAPPCKFCLYFKSNKQSFKFNVTWT